MNKQKIIADLQEIITVARKVYRNFRNEGRKKEAQEVRIKIKILEEKVEEILKAKFSTWSESVIELISQLNDIQKEVKGAIDEIQVVQDKLDKFIGIVKKIDEAVKITSEVIGKII